MAEVKARGQRVAEAYDPRGRFDEATGEFLAPLTDQAVDGLLAGGEIGILVVTTDGDVLQTVRETVELNYPVEFATDVSQALGIMSAGDFGVVVVDTVVAGARLDTFIEQLRSRAPATVTILAGERDAGNELMELFTSGQVHRILLKPLSPGQTRRSVGSAVNKHLQLRTQPLPVMRPPPKRRNPGLLVGAVAVVASFAGIAWWVIPKLPQDTTSESSGTLAASPQPEASRPADNTAEAPVSELERRLRAARIAFDQGLYLEPVGISALDQYLAALEIQPDDDSANRGVDAVAQVLLSRAESAVLENRIDDATTTLEVVRDIRPDHQRLAFVDTQLRRQRDRQLSSRALAALAVDDFDGAIQMAETAAEPGEPNGVAELVAAAIIDRALEAVAAGSYESALAMAESARNLSPAHDGAGSVERAIEADHDRFVQAALEQAGRGRFEQAKIEIERAGQLPLGDADARAAASKQIDQLRDTKRIRTEKRRAAQVQELKLEQVNALLAQAQGSLKDNRLVTPPGESSLFYLTKAQEIVPDHPGVTTGFRQLSDGLITRAMARLETQDFVEAEQWLMEAAALGTDQQEVGVALGELEQRWAAFESNRVVPANQLRIVSSAPPEYPSLAARRQVEGWVDVEFTVTLDGNTRDVIVIAAEREGYFEQATVEAVSGWRFEPRAFRGRPIEQRVSARVSFSYE